MPEAQRQIPTQVGLPQTKEGKLSHAQNVDRNLRALTPSAKHTQASGDALSQPTGMPYSRSSGGGAAAMTEGAAGRSAGSSSIPRTFAAAAQAKGARRSSGRAGRGIMKGETEGSGASQSASSPLSSFGKLINPLNLLSIDWYLRWFMPWKWTTLEKFLRPVMLKMMLVFVAAALVFFSVAVMGSAVIGAIDIGI